MKKSMDNLEFLEFFLEDDLMFYDKFLVGLSDEELEKFLEDNPEFMKEDWDEEEIESRKETVLKQIFAMEKISSNSRPH